MLTPSGMRLARGTPIEGTAPMRLTMSEKRSSSVICCSTSRARRSAADSVAIAPISPPPAMAEDSARSHRLGLRQSSDDRDPRRSRLRLATSPEPEGGAGLGFYRLAEAGGSARTLSHDDGDEAT